MVFAMDALDFAPLRISKVAKEAGAADCEESLHVKGRADGEVFEPKLRVMRLAATGMKVVIFSEEVAGHGHMKAAEALTEGIFQLDPTASVKVIRALPLVSESLEKATESFYRQLVQKAPRLWGWAYKQERNHAAWMKKITAHIIAHRIASVLEKESPDIILCTHAFALSGLAYLKRSKKFAFRLGVSITDFDVHHFWIYPEVDFYLVGCQAMKEKISQDYLVEASKIYDTGIPIKASFGEASGTVQGKHLIREQLGLKPGFPTILLTGGGWGYGPIPRIVEILQSLSSALQIIVVTGNNEELYRSLKQQAFESDWPYPVQIYGYVDFMKSLLQASDILIAKPGGLTSSEALAMGIPLIIYQPIPGQEERNASFLVSSGAAVRADDEAELAHWVSELIVNKDTLQQLQNVARGLGKPKSSLEGARAALEYTGIN